MSGAKTCEACGVPLFFARTMRGRSMPLETAPIDGGNVVLERVGAETLARVVQAEKGVKRYVAHFARCPKAAEFRRPT